MRKHRICAAALCLALCLLLSACGGRTAPPEIPDEEEEEQSAPVLSAAARECLGEWVSSGNTEDVLVLNEDFTCDVNGRTLHWTADTADRGFFRLEEQDGSFVYYFRVGRDPDGVYALNLAGLIPAEEGSRFSRRSTGKDFMRRDVVEALDLNGGFEVLDAAVLGKWVLVNADPEAKEWPASLTVSEGGSVTVDGTPYTYVYQDYMRDTYEGGIPDTWDVVLYDEAGEHAGGLYFQKRSSETGSVFLSVQVSLGQDRYFTYYQGEAVAVTPDNFASFFDISEKITAETNSFGEVSNLYCTRTVTLKEEYADRFISASLPIEYTVGNYIAKYVTYDTATGEYTVKDTDDEPSGIWVSSESNSYTSELRNLIQGSNLSGSYVRFDDKDDEESTVLSGYVSAPTEFSVDRVEGTLFLGKPLPAE